MPFILKNIFIVKKSQFQKIPSKVYAVEFSLAYFKPMFHSIPPGNVLKPLVFRHFQGVQFWVYLKFWVLKFWIYLVFLQQAVPLIFDRFLNTPPVFFSCLDNINSFLINVPPLYLLKASENYDFLMYSVFIEVEYWFKMGLKYLYTVYNCTLLYTILKNLYK